VPRPAAQLTKQSVDTWISAWQGATYVG